jgi:hypothetical protein
MLEILGGDECWIAYKLDKFIKSVKNLKKKIEAQIARDKETAPFILFQIGLRVNNYLTACERADSVEDVSKSIMNTDSIEDRIRNLEMHPVLPSSFKNNLKREREDVDEGGEPNGNGSKRGRGNDGKKHGGAKVVRNEDPFEELTLKDGEKWKSFSGRDARKGLPAWGDCKMCPKWHIRGLCFDDCNDVKSHVPKGEVSAKKRKEMQAWKKAKTA